MNRSISIFVCFLIPACTIGGRTLECIDDRECGSNGQCIDGACRTSEPPPPDGTCAPRGTELSLSPADTAAMMIGRWRICETSGLPLFLNSEAIAIELAIDGTWRNLGEDIDGALVPLRGDDDRGLWGLSEMGVLTIDRSGSGPGLHLPPVHARATFTQGPRLLELEGEEHLGALVLAPVFPAALACERHPMELSPQSIDLTCDQPGQHMCGYCPNDMPAYLQCDAERRSSCWCGIPELDRLRHGLGGIWRGTRSGGVLPATIVYMSFPLYKNASTNYSPLCADCACTTFGTFRDDGGHFEVLDLNADGSGRGTIFLEMLDGRPDATTVDQIRLSEAGDHLSFEVTHFELGVIAFDLQRAAGTPKTGLARCSETEASCECGAPSCCIDSSGIVCVSCAEDRCSGH